MVSISCNCIVYFHFFSFTPFASSFCLIFLVSLKIFCSTLLSGRFMLFLCFKAHGLIMFSSELCKFCVLGLEFVEKE